MLAPVVNLYVVVKIGEDPEILQKVEARIQADFRSGLPPHLQPDAKNVEYQPGSDQSRIFVTSHQEFKSLPDRDVQRILRDRIILVHGNPLDYGYGWDLFSFARLYDIDRKIEILGEIVSNPLGFLVTMVSVPSKPNFDNPDSRHHWGTLRELHALTSGQSNGECPPLNALSLPAHRRNNYVPCQFASLASHEVAQSRMPKNYERAFSVPDIKSQMEWSIIGSKNTISPFHIDAEGFATALVVLEGSKYWIVATRFGEDEKMCAINSLGPGWHPHFINEGDNVDRFRFEAVHLQKGDMLWVSFQN